MIVKNYNTVVKITIKYIYTITNSEEDTFKYTISSQQESKCLYYIVKQVLFLPYFCFCNVTINTLMIITMFTSYKSNINIQ